MKMNLLKKAVVGLSALLLITSCGKKSSGGGSTTATAPQDCSGTDCQTGNQYASGVFVKTTTGQGRINTSNNIVLTLHLFGKDPKGFDGDNFTKYSGEVITTGSAKIRSGSYYGVSSLATRMISGLTIGIDFNFGLGFGYGYDSGYDNYDDGYDYYPPTYQPPTHCNSGCYNPPTTGGSSCKIPAGDYKVVTVDAGDFTSSSSSSSRLRNLVIKLDDGNNEVEATVRDTSVTSSRSSSTTAVLRGQLLVSKVNGKTCNQSVTLN